MLPSLPSTVNLCAMPMWAKMTNSASHPAVAIARKQKWVIDNAMMITDNAADEPLSSCQWYQKRPSSERIAPGDPDLRTCCPSTPSFV